MASQGFWTCEIQLEVISGGMSGTGNSSFNLYHWYIIVALRKQGVFHIYIPWSRVHEQMLLSN